MRPDQRFWTKHYHFVKPIYRKVTAAAATNTRRWTFYREVTADAARNTRGWAFYREVTADAARDLITREIVSVLDRRKRLPLDSNATGKSNVAA